MALKDCLAQLDTDALTDEEIAQLTQAEQARLDQGDDPVTAGTAAVRDLLAAQRADRTYLQDRIALAGGRAPSRGQRYQQFAGVEASTADTYQLATAIDRVNQGWDADEVREETGWHQGPDGKWRFEISDDKAEMNIELQEMQVTPMFAEDEAVYRLGDVIKHDALFAAYPDAADIEIIVSPRKKGTQAWFDPFGEKPRIGVSPTADDPLSSILHEVQHFIQRKEGFATGGNADTVIQEIMESKSASKISAELQADAAQTLARLRAAQESPTRDKFLDANRKQAIQALEARLAGLKAGDKDTLRATIQSSGLAFDLYRRLFGEVEARNTQARRGMTPQQRKTFGPETTQDVSDNNVIVLFNGQEMQSATRPANAPRTQGETEEIDDQIFIRLSNASDLSTFLHESAHLYLIMEGRFAREFGMTENQQAILEMLGVDSFEAIGSTEQELFARTYENYLMQGKAPSLKLRDAFAAFSDWLSRIYSGLKQAWLEGLGKPLTPEVTQVFDRLLATQVELQQAMVGPEYAAMFRSPEEIGMTPKEWESYQKRVAAHRKRSQMTLEDKVLEAFRKWHSDEWKAERNDLIDEELEKLQAEPIYRLLEVLSIEKMDSALVKDALGVDKLPPGRLLGMSSKTGALDPTMLAEEFGFDDVPTMLSDIRGVDNIRTKAKENAQDRMVEKYGDILNDGTIEAEAREAFHNEQHAELLLEEIKILRKKSKRAPDVDNDQIKALAGAAVDAMRASDIQPGKFYRAEIRAARKAASATDPARAREYKIQQLTNHHLFVAATKAQQAYAKARPFVKALQTRSYNPYEVDPNYAVQIQALARLYDTTNPKDRKTNFDQLVEWYETQLLVNPELKIEDHELISAIAARKVQRDAGQRPTHVYQPKKFEELTVAEVQGLVTMLRHLRWVGGKESLAGQEATKAERAEVIAGIEAEGGKDRPDPDGPGEFDGVLDGISHFINSTFTIRNLVRRLDGFKDGPLHKYVFLRLAKANNEKLRLTREVAEKYKEELATVSELSLGRGKRHSITQMKQDGTTWTLDEEHRVMLALYWGHEYAREAVRKGHGVTDADVEAMLGTLTEAQVKLVNAVWKINESMWPELAQAGTRRYGTAPASTTALPFTIGQHKFTGGHMRLYYRRNTKKTDLQEGGNFFLNGMAPGKAGSLMDLKGSGGKRVQLDKQNIFRAIDENIHFMAYSDAGLELQRLLNNDNVQEVITRKHGKGFLQAFTDSVQGLTVNGQSRELNRAMATILRGARKARTYSFLAYSVRNTIQQLSAIPIVVRDTGTVNYLGHVASFYGTGRAREKIAFVEGKSQYMRNRAQLVNRDAAEFMRQVVVTGKASKLWETFKHHGFTPQTYVDMVISYPAWMAKYEAEIQEHNDTERAAIAADTLVSESVGSGSDLHLGTFYRSNQNEYVRTLTAFGSWFNTYWNRMYRATKGGTDFFSMDAFDAIVTAPLMVSVMSAAVILDGPDRRDDQSIWGWIGETYGRFMLASMIGIRDVVGALDGFSPEAGHSAYVELPKRVLELEGQLADDTKGAAGDISSTLKVASAVAPIPGSGLLTRVLDYVESYEGGNEDEIDDTADLVREGYQAMVEGPDRND